MQDVLDRVTKNPKFHEFIAMRSRYSIIMAIVSAAIYYGFILLVAFDKELLAKKVGCSSGRGCHRHHHRPDLDLRSPRQHRV